MTLLIRIKQHIDFRIRVCGGGQIEIYQILPVFVHG